MRHECTVIERWPAIDSSTGLHLLGEWYGCAGRRILLEDADELQRLCLSATRKAGLPSVGHLFRRRTPAGVTGTVLLPDAHLAIHTQPDDLSATLDVFVGTRMRNNRTKAHAVYAYLRDGLMPDKENILQVDGGGLAGVVLPPD